MLYHRNKLYKFIEDGNFVNINIPETYKNLLKDIPISKKGKTTYVKKILKGMILDGVLCAVDNGTLYINDKFVANDKSKRNRPS